MSKPEWSDAPAWAMWVAMDGDGFWFWHQEEPKANYTCEDWESEGLIKLACEEAIVWDESAERRP